MQSLSEVTRWSLVFGIAWEAGIQIRIEQGPTGDEARWRRGHLGYDEQLTVHIPTAPKHGGMRRTDA